MNPRPTFFAILIGGLVASTGAFVAHAQPSPPRPPFTVVVDMRELMVSLMQPAAEKFWDLLGESVTAAGVVDTFPRTDEEWDRAHQNATLLAEMGNLLMIDGRARDNDEWMMRSADLIDVSTRILKAVNARDRARMEKLATELDESCGACHRKYLPRR